MRTHRDDVVVAGRQACQLVSVVGKERVVGYGLRLLAEQATVGVGCNRDLIRDRIARHGLPLKVKFRRRNRDDRRRWSLRVGCPGYGSGWSATRQVVSRDDKCKGCAGGQSDRPVTGLGGRDHDGRSASNLDGVIVGTRHGDSTIFRSRTVLRTRPVWWAPPGKLTRVAAWDGFELP